MSALREAAQQALEALELVTDLTNHDDEIYDAITTLRAALKQETEAAAWLAERKNHWRKEREKALAAKDQDPELSAALGWPGGISNPVLDRVQLLQMVAALRVSAPPDDWTRCHHCGQTMPPVPLGQAEPAQEPVAMDWLHKWANQDDGAPETQWHEGYEAARRVVQIHLTAPPKAEPAQEPMTTLGYAARKIEELIAQRDALLETLKYIAKQFRQHGRQHWPEAVAARLAIEAVEGEKT